MRKSIIIRNKVIPIWLLGIIAASIFVSIVAGAYVYHLDIQGTVTIEGSNPGADYQVKAYEDFECTEPLTNIDFGTMKAGTHKYVTIYLKNTGNGTIHKIEGRTECTLSARFQRNVNFKPGDVYILEVPISIASDAPAGSHSVTVTLDFVA